MPVIVVDTSSLTRWGRMLHFEAAAVAKRVEPAVVAQAAEVEARTAQQAPVLTGALRQSIRTTGRGLRRRVAAGSAKAYYAPFQEFGTRKMSPNPFLITQANPRTHHELVQKVATAVFAGELMRGGRI